MTAEVARTVSALIPKLEKGNTDLMIWPGCLRALILGITSHWDSSLDVQKGWSSGTDRQMKAKQAQYFPNQL